MLQPQTFWAVLQLLFRNVENNDTQINEACLRFIPTFEVCCLQGQKKAHVRWVIAQTPKAFQSVADTCWIEHVFLNWREMDAFKVKPLLADRVGAVWSLNGEVAFLHLKRFTCASETRGPWKDSNLSRPQLVVTEQPTRHIHTYPSFDLVPSGSAGYCVLCPVGQSLLSFLGSGEIRNAEALWGKKSMSKSSFRNTSGHTAW